MISDGASPEKIIQVRRITGVLGQIGRETIEFNVTISEKHRFRPAALVVVPDRRRKIRITITLPAPVALDDLIGRFAGNHRLLDGSRCCQILATTAGYVLNTKVI